MGSNQSRPRSVTAMGVLFIGVGIVGLAYHASEVDLAHPFQSDALLIQFVRLLAVVAGVFILRGANWARWLAIAWMAFHVIVSALHSAGEALAHAVLLAAIAYVLLRPAASAYFRRTKARPVSA